MYQYKGLEDTIAAIATPAGFGAIGIVRLSGKEAVGIADRVLRLSSGKKLAECKSHTVHHGQVYKDNLEIIDEVLVTLMRAPRSYTTQDVVEINCHGGALVLHAVLKAVLSHGARLAEPGEFTKRAFLCGRLDLTQAEAVMDTIGAQTENFLRIAENQLKGQLSQVLTNIREELSEIFIALEAIINFPEDELDADSRGQIIQRLQTQGKTISQLLNSAEGGRILKEGIRLVLCGRPNVGKSSLLNGLLKQQRAIVTDIAGTTRDVLEESIDLKGFLIQLVDTAGILQPRDLIEEEAIKRSQLYIDGADLVLLVLDGSCPIQEADRVLIEQLKSRQVLVVINKRDLENKLDRLEVEQIFPPHRLIDACALNTDSLEALEVKIIDTIQQIKHLDTHGIVISNIRHIKALESAQEHVQEASLLIKGNTPFEIICEEIKGGINQLDAITGRNIDEDLLDRIFSQFCIGK